MSIYLSLSRTHLYKSRSTKFFFFSFIISYLNGLFFFFVKLTSWFWSRCHFLHHSVNSQWRRLRWRWWSTYKRKKKKEEKHTYLVSGRLFVFLFFVYTYICITEFFLYRGLPRKCTERQITSRLDGTTLLFFFYSSLTCWYNTKNQSVQRCATLYYTY